MVSLVIISLADAFQPSDADNPPAPTPAPGSEAGSSVYTPTGRSSVLAPLTSSSVYPLSQFVLLRRCLRDNRVTQCLFTVPRTADKDKEE